MEQQEAGILPGITLCPRPLSLLSQISGEFRIFLEMACFAVSLCGAHGHLESEKHCQIIDAAVIIVGRRDGR